MTQFPRSTVFLALGLAASLCAAGCHGNHRHDNAADQGQATQSQGQDQDPAAANLAPASYNTAGAPADNGASDQSAGSQSYASTQDESQYSEPATESAPQAPPPLPDYQQPPDPGDGYIWTPGYWNYATTGYYWVPGAWVAPPYTGALWTPGFWGFSSGRYLYHPGYWGTHIGFYGGINYGFGYAGLGYEGGYWNSGHFMYNRVYNNINTTVVHNTYSYNVRNRETVVNHVSFNGGAGGVQMRPQPQEVRAHQEPYAPRMATQIQHAESFRNDRNQFVDVNHGRPANVAINRPIEAEPNVHPTPPNEHIQVRGGPTQRVAPARMPEPQRPGNARDDHR
jgi:hypothetical protein